MGKKNINKLGVIELLHDVISGNFVIRFFSYMYVFMLRQLSEYVILPCIYFTCFRFVDGVCGSFSKALKGIPLAFLLVGGCLLPVTIGEYVLYGFVKTNLLPLATNSSDSILEHWLYLAIVFGVITIIRSPVIKLDDNLYKTIEAKTKAIKEESGIKGMQFQKCIDCEIPKILRGSHCPICRSFIFLN